MQAAIGPNAPDAETDDEVMIVLSVVGWGRPRPKGAVGKRFWEQ